MHTIMCCDVSKGIHHVIDHPAYLAGVKGQIEKIAESLGTRLPMCVNASQTAIYIARTSLMVCGLVQRK